MRLVEYKTNLAMIDAASLALVSEELMSSVVQDNVQRKIEVQWCGKSVILGQPCMKGVI